MWTLFWALVDKFLDLGIGANKIVEKTLPTPEMSKQIYEDKRTIADGDRMQEIFRKACNVLKKPWNRGLVIDDFVDFKHDALDADDKAELKKLLHQRFPKRK